MGISVDALLVYGYDLGSDDDVRIQEVDDAHGTPQVSWWNENSINSTGEPEGIFSGMMRALCSTKSDTLCTWPWQHDDIVLHHYGVQLVPHCSDEFPMYVLATYLTKVHYGNVKYLDLADLVTLPMRAEWDDKLHMALNTLGIHPKQKKPAWLLVSSWG